MAAIGSGGLFMIVIGLGIAFGVVVLVTQRLRRRRAGHLARELGLGVAAAEEPVRRGGEVEALVTISNTQGLGDVVVGLVCAELYDESEDTDNGSGRTTSRATAFETWRPIESLVGTQSVRFSIPVQAPFSYTGKCLSFKWELVARGRRAHHVDPEARSELRVSP